MTRATDSDFAAAREEGERKLAEAVADWRMRKIEADPKLFPHIREEYIASAALHIRAISAVGSRVVVYPPREGEGKP